VRTDITRFERGLSHVAGGARRTLTEHLLPSGTSKLGEEDVMRAAAVVPQPRSTDGPVLNVDGRLHAPRAAELLRAVQARLHRGERTIVLSLARVAVIDAAGIGELVRAYNMTVAVGGSLRITHVTPFVRELLVRVGLFDILTKGSEVQPQFPRVVVTPNLHR
jgi:anti-anti-sigma factor